MISELKKKDSGKKRRRGNVFECKNGCGFKYIKENPTNKKKRDLFDYHQNQGCPLIKRISCPIKCERNGEVITFKGLKALKNHVKNSQIHLKNLHLLKKKTINIQPFKFEFSLDDLGITFDENLTKEINDFTKNKN